MKFPNILRFALGAALAVGFSTTVHAQATRTWVSGVGDDVNPCSRTAPCKTLAGAISKTAAGGEINAIDPGGFGAVTIIKSMTIDLYSTEGGVLAGGNGVVVNLPATTDVVVLRGLDIFGVNPPSNGIRFIQNGTLHVQHCRIKRFNAASSCGIQFAPTGASELYVSDTQISENGNGSTGAGILIKPSRGGSARVVLNRVEVNNNSVGLIADGTGSATGLFVNVVDSALSGNLGDGVSAISPAGGAPVTVLLDKSAVTLNKGDGVNANGAVAPGANGNAPGSATIRIGGSCVSMNATGMSITSAGFLRSYGDNYIDGNLAGNGPFTTTPPK